MIRIVKLILYYFAYQLAVGSIFICADAIIRYIKTKEFVIPNIPNDPHTLTLSLLAEIIALLALATHLIVGNYLPLDKRTFSLYSTKLILICIPLILSFQIGAGYFNEQANLPDRYAELFSQMLNHPLGIITIVIISPLFEEIFFRGAIEGYLLRIWKNPAWAILLSGLIFSLVHANLAQIPFAFITGILFGWIYYRTGSLLPCIFMHFINNGSAYLLYQVYPDSNMEKLFGNGTLIWVFGGIAITILCIWYIDKRLCTYPTNWQTNNKI